MEFQRPMCKVNRETIRTVIREKELKAWWIAEQIGVHKTTLRRWLSGRIQRAHEGKVSHLAELLQIEVSRLTLVE